MKLASVPLTSLTAPEVQERRDFIRRVHDEGFNFIATRDYFDTASGTQPYIWPTDEMLRSRFAGQYSRLDLPSVNTIYWAFRTAADRNAFAALYRADSADAGPTFTSLASVSNPEGSKLAHKLTCAEDGVTFSLTAGADQARFALTGGTLTWAADGIKDFEVPDDADLNNTYIVVVTATDDEDLTTTQTVTVTVTNVA